MPKETYEMPSPLARMLKDNGFNTVAIENAVKAIKGAAKLVESKDTNGAIKLKEQTKSDKAHTSFVLKTNEKYRADDSAPMRFGSWTDAMADVWKKHGEPHAELSIAVMPAHLYVWIDGTDSFKVKDGAEAKAKEKAEAKAALEATRQQVTDKASKTGQRSTTPVAAPAS